MVAEKVQKLEQENLSLKRQVAELQSLCETRTELPKTCEYNLKEARQNARRRFSNMGFVGRFI